MVWVTKSIENIVSRSGIFRVRKFVSFRINVIVKIRYDIARIIRGVSFLFREFVFISLIKEFSIVRNIAVVIMTTDINRDSIIFC